MCVLLGWLSNGTWNRGHFCLQGCFFGSVFRFLFAGKGVSGERRTFFEKYDFNAVYFPLGWDSWVDSHGQGMKVFYPLTLKKYIYWSPKKYEMGMGGISTLLPRAYQGKISFNFTKVALNDWVMKSYWNKINCGNWTEQSAIWSVIIQVISE